MENVQAKLNEMKSEMEKLRDMVKLQAHLGKAEAKEELEKLENEWKSLQQKFQPLANEVEQTAKNTGAALEVAAEELKAGFQRLRKLL